MIGKNDTVTVGRHALAELMRERDNAVARLRAAQDIRAAAEKRDSPSAQLVNRNKALRRENEQLMIENYDLRKQLHSANSSSGKYQLDERRDAIEGIISNLQALLPDEA